MPRRIGCGEPDHLTRVGQQGFSVFLAVRADLPGDAEALPVIPVDGYLCMACTPVVNLRRALELEQKDAQLAATRQKLILLGLTVEDVDTFVPKSAAALLMAQSAGPSPEALMAAGRAAAAAVSKKS